MYQDLRSKLELYKKSLVNVEKSGVETQRSMQGTIIGTEVNNDNGSFFMTGNEYPHLYIHGGCSLGDALKVKMQSIKRICSDIPHDLKIEDLLFLDTETTGLSGGTGTVAFLIGAGFFCGDSFVLKQFFMRDYDEEPAMLESFAALLSRFKGLVTFNGKCFDWNLLNTRFLFNRMRNPLGEPVHLDLLFPSRRLWRMKLESCSLDSLEQHILDEYRTDDIPGYMIPSVYFRYIENRDEREIKKVIKHNEKDILSMVSLLVKIASMLENPLSDDHGVQELLGLGRIFEANGEYNIVTHCFELCMKSENHSVKEAASKKLSDIYKRSGNYSKAVEHWRSMIDNPGISSIHPLIELAKYYEHKEKNIPKALEFTRKALRLSSEVGFKNNIYYSDIKKRLDRLERKAGRFNKNA